MHTMSVRSPLVVAALSTLPMNASDLRAQERPKVELSYDESKVPAYTLPDPLVMQDGRPVKTVAAWRKRRQEILGLFAEQVYGAHPGKPKHFEAVTTSVVRDALGGKATRKEVSIRLSPKADRPRMDLLLFIPNRVRGPVPAFLGLNFNGNHTIHPDPTIKMTDEWVRAGRPGVEGNRSTEASRGTAASRWPIEEIVARGYALVTLYYGDLDPDFDDGFQNGVHPLFYKPGQTRPGPGEWGSLAAWSWGLMRALDYLQTEKAIDARKVAVVGHSRLGKAALWAAAQDERFALAISNNSGAGGAALARRRFGETIEHSNVHEPHRFCANYRRYIGKEDELPVDQHMLLALLAPRPVYVASASEDHLADPKGEFLAAKGAEPVYALHRLQGLGVDEQPPVNTPVGGAIGYHLREGVHDMTAYDWQQYLAFADGHLRGARRR